MKGKSLHLSDEPFHLLCHSVGVMKKHLLEKGLQHVLKCGILFNQTSSRLKKCFFLILAYVSDNQYVAYFCEMLTLSPNAFNSLYGLHLTVTGAVSSGRTRAR